MGIVGCLLTTRLEGISDGQGDASPSDGNGDVADVVDGVKKDADAPVDTCDEPSGVAWSKPTKLAGAVGPGGEVTFEPYGLPDGLSILLVTRIADKGRIHLATRTSTIASFGGTTTLSIDAIDNGGFPAASPDLHEIIFSNNGQMWVGTRVGSSGSFTTREYPPPVNSGVPGEGSTWATLAADGRVLGYAAGPLFKWKLYEARRTNTSPGANWASAAELKELNDPASTYVSFCPAYSNDGLHIWFLTNQTGASLVYHAKRSTIDGKFGSIAPVSSFAGTNACPRSVTKNGCEMYLTCTVGGVDQTCISKRVGTP